MSVRTSTRISALLLFIHGAIEIVGPMVLVIFKLKIPGGFGADGLSLSIIGLAWGATRLVAGWGIWHQRDWAIMLGILMSAITMTAAVSIVPVGVVDTILSAPVLMLLLYTWFERETLENEEAHHVDRENGTTP